MLKIMIKTAKEPDLRKISKKTAINIIQANKTRSPILFHFAEHIFVHCLLIPLIDILKLSKW